MLRLFTSLTHRFRVFRLVSYALSLIVLAFASTPSAFAQTTPTHTLPIGAKRATLGVLGAMTVDSMFRVPARAARDTTAQTGNKLRTKGAIFYDSTSKVVYVYDGTRFVNVGANIYNIDGSLTGARKLTMNGQNLTFDATTGNFIYNPTSTGKMGIGTASPVSKLHINGAVRADSVVITSIQSGSATTDSLLVIDNQNRVKRISPTSVRPARDSSIYSENGTIRANRTITMTDKNLIFNSTTGNVQLLPTGTGSVSIGSTAVAGTNKLSVTGNTNLGGTLNVTGATTLGGTANVTGATTLNGAVSMSNASVTMSALPNATPATPTNFLVLSTGNAVQKLAAASLPNLYNTNGNLAAARTVTMNNNNLTFNATTGNFIFNPTTSGKMGIGTASPISKLHVQGAVRADSLVLQRLGNRATTQTTDSLLVIGTDNIVRKVAPTTAVVTNTIYSANSDITSARQVGLGAHTLTFGKTGETAADALVIQGNTGRVGIGTNTLNNKFTVRGSTLLDVSTVGTTTGGLQIQGLQPAATTALTTTTTPNQLVTITTGNNIQTISADNVPNLYTKNGTLSSSRQVTMGNNNLEFRGAGKVGIGTTATPISKLEVKGAVRADSVVITGIQSGSATTDSLLVIDNQNRVKRISPTSVRPARDSSIYSENGTIRANRTITMTGNNLTFNATTGNFIYNPGAGKMGIGTTSPISKLHVQGAVRADSLVLQRLGNRATTQTTDSLLVIGTDNIVRKVAPTTAVVTNTIYSADGSLNGDRKVTLSTHKLTFGATSVGTENTLVLDGTLGNVGIGVAAPSVKLQVRGGVDLNVRDAALKFQGLRAASSSQFGDSLLNISATDGTVRKIAAKDIPINTIYNSDGTLTGTNPRKLTMNANNLTFESTTGNFIYNPTTSGKMGIGTTSPISKLHVQGEVRADSLVIATAPTRGDAVNDSLLVIDAQGRVKRVSPQRIQPGQDSSIYSVNGNIRANRTITMTGNNLTFNATTGNFIYNPSTGKMGVGTASPISKLHVAGAVRADSLVFAGNGAGVTTSNATTDQMLTISNDGKVTKRAIAVAVTPNTLYTADGTLSGFATGTNVRTLTIPANNNLRINTAQTAANQATGHLFLLPTGTGSVNIGTTSVANGFKLNIAGGSVLTGTLALFNLPTGTIGQTGANNSAGANIADSVLSISRNGIVYKRPVTTIQNIYNADGTIPVNAQRVVTFGNGAALTFGGTPNRDLNTLVIHGTTGRVSIGTATTTNAKFTVAGSTTIDLATTGGTGTGAGVLTLGSLQTANNNAQFSNNLLNIGADGAVRQVAINNLPLNTLYRADGTLTGARKVTLGNNHLTFHTEGRSTNGKIKIGNSSQDPQALLDIDATNTASTPLLRLASANPSYTEFRMLNKSNTSAQDSWAFHVGGNNNSLAQSGSGLAAGNFGLYNNGKYALTIDRTSKNVGIGGITAPISALQVQGAVRTDSLVFAGNGAGVATSSATTDKMLTIGADGKVTKRDIAVAVTPNTLYTADGSLNGDRKVTLAGHQLIFTNPNSDNFLKIEAGGTSHKGGIFLSKHNSEEGWKVFNNQATNEFTIASNNGTSPTTLSTRFAVKPAGNILMPSLATAANTTGLSVLMVGADGEVKKGTIPTTKNIYDNDGTLTGARKVTLGTNKLTFDVTSAANTLVLSGLGNVGIGVADPSVKLQVRGGVDLNVRDAALKFQGLRAALTPQFSDSLLNIATDGTVRKIAAKDIPVHTIYNQDGTLTAARTVTLGNNNLTFTNNGTTTPRVLFFPGGVNGQVGIGTNNPEGRLHVTGSSIVFASEGLKFQSLQNRTTTQTGDSLLVIGADNIVRKTATLSTTNIYNADGAISGGARTVTLNSNLSFTGGGNVSIGGAAGAGNKLSVTGNTNLGGNLTVTGASSTLRNVTASGTANITGATTLGNTLTLNSVAQFTNPTATTQVLVLQGATNGVVQRVAASSLPANNIYTQNGTINGNRTVSFQNNTTTTLTFGANNLVLRGGNVGIGVANPTNKLQVQGATQLNGTLNVTGATTINAATTINNNLSVAQGLNVTGQSRFGNQVTLNNATLITTLPANTNVLVRNNAGVVQQIAASNLPANNIYTRDGKTEKNTTRTFEVGGTLKFVNSTSSNAADVANSGQVYIDKLFFDRGGAGIQISTVSSDRMLVLDNNGRVKKKDFTNIYTANGTIGSPRTVTLNSNLSFTGSGNVNIGGTGTGNKLSVTGNTNLNGQLTLNNVPQNNSPTTNTQVLVLQGATNGQVQRVPVNRLPLNNIYNQNGTLSSQRTVSMGNNRLIFAGTNTGGNYLQIQAHNGNAGFSGLYLTENNNFGWVIRNNANTDNLEFVTASNNATDGIALFKFDRSNNGRLGIGMDNLTTPSANLHVRGSVRLQGLPTITNPDDMFIMADGNGNLRRSQHSFQQTVTNIFRTQNIAVEAKGSHTLQNNDGYGDASNSGLVARGVWAFGLDASANNNNQVGHYAEFNATTQPGGTTNSKGRGFQQVGSNGSVNLVGKKFALLVSGDALIRGTLFVISDKRTKDIRGIVSGQTAMEKLARLRVTDYTYKDTARNHAKQERGVIAQELEQVLPEAVNISHDEQAVPDIYKSAESVQVKGNTLAITLPVAHSLKIGDKVQVIEGKSERNWVVKSVISEHTFAVAKPARVPTKLFVYGRVVKDMRSVNYNYIMMTNVAATQELIQKASAQEEVNAKQQAQLSEQAKEIETLKAQMKTLMEKLEEE